MIFRFKHFAVSHGASAMKVGTDGVTLGAWAPCLGRVLDVGCGCGLIGLMAAQRGATEVVMVEIDPAAAAEATQNASASPWAEKVTVHCADFLQFNAGERYDSIISNPPFFANGELAPDSRRAAARHEGDLTPEAFMRRAASLLAPGGTVSVILPPDRVDAWTFAAKVSELHPQCLCRLLTKPGARERRTLITFGTEVPECRTADLIISSPDYQQLVSDFYL